MIKIKKLEHDLCQVCFVKPHTVYPYSQIIRCITCSQMCHKFCYNPSIFESQFQCDLCADGANRNQTCYICGNRGLLKKIEGNYAHPLCLLYSQNVFVVEYSSLKFAIVKSQKKSKSDRKFNCMNCQNPGSLEKCFADCQNRVHMYCAWKCFQKAEENVWNHNTIVDDYDYQHFFQMKAVEYLRRFNETLGSLLGSGRKQPQKVRQFQLVCKDHLDSVFECCTQQKYFQKQNIEYIQCDQCLRWYHKECLDRKCMPKNQQSAFICPCCIDFSQLLQKIDQKDELSLQRYPRFNVCDMIFLQYFFERKQYKLSQKEMKLMFSLPFEPSIKFLERILLNNIEEKIKVSNFQSLCDLKLEQRMSKKLFKEKFKNKLQIVMKLIIGKQSLHQLREQHHAHTHIQKQTKNKSHADLFEQEKASLTEWINLFGDFKSTRPNFANISEKIIQKLRKWLREIEEGSDIKEHESDQSQIQNSSDNFFEDKLKPEKVKAKESESEQSSQIEEIAQTQKQPDDQKGKSFFVDSNSRKQSSSEPKHKAILDEQKQAMIVNGVKTIQKELSVLKSDKEKLHHLQLELGSLEIGSLGLNKFQFKTLMDGNLDPTEIFWVLIMEKLLSEFQKVLFSFKDTRSQSTFCTEYFGDSNRSQGHLVSIKLQIVQKRRSLFVKLYLNKIAAIHAAFPSKIRKQFKPKIQYFMNLAQEMIEVNWQKNKGQIQEKLSFQEMLKHCSNDSCISYFKSLKTKIRDTFDRGELELFRLEIERKKVMSKISKIQFTLLKSNQISQELEVLCQSSSSQIELQSGQGLRRTNKLREQIIGMQKDCLQKWLKMFSLVFNLSEQMAELTNDGLHMEERKSSDQKISTHGQEPLDLITMWIQTDLKNCKAQTKSKIISEVVIFFEGLRQSRINFRVFHPKLSQIVPKLAWLCFSYCAQNMKSWSSNEFEIEVVRYLYKNFKFYQLSDQRYSKIRDILETDQKYSQYLNGVKDLLFKDPETTHKVQQQIMGSMIRFYRQNSLVCRVSKLSQISAWIMYYQLSLDIIGTQQLVPEQYQTPMQNDSKRSPKQRITFNILSVLVCQLHKHRFPSCYFTEKMLQMYEKAYKIQKIVSQFFSKQEKAIELSYRLKSGFEEQFDIEKHCIQFQSDAQVTENKISTAEFHQLISIIDRNEVSEIISFEIEKLEILNERKSFDSLVRRAEHILEKCDTNDSIKSLNVLLLRIVSSPYSYVNINALQKYIQKRQASINSHQGRFKKYVERQYCTLLDFLCQSNDANGQKLTRTQVLLKIKQLEELPEYKQISRDPYLQELLLRIVTKIEEYDVIKDRLNLVYLKIDSNQRFSHQEILALEEPLQRYKAQNIEEFNFQILFDNFGIYKLAFTQFKDLNCSEREKVLDKLRGLKKQFLTPEFQKRKQQIQVSISPY